MKTRPKLTYIDGHWLDAGPHWYAYTASDHPLVTQYLPAIAARRLQLATIPDAYAALDAAADMADGYWRAVVYWCGSDATAYRLAPELADAGGTWQHVLDRAQAMPSRHGDPIPPTPSK